MKKKRPRMSGGYIKIIPIQKTKDNSVSNDAKEVIKGGADNDQPSTEDKSPDEAK